MSVFSLTEATASDLVTVRNTARLISENQAVKQAGSGGSAGPRKMYKPLVIVGPSGAGKGTLINHITGMFPNKFGFSVSTTTRSPRQGETHGTHYNFVTREKFDEMIAKDEFIEHKDVHSNKYGTTKAAITKI